LEDNGDISRAWDNIRENIKILAQGSLCYCESKHHKSWIGEKYSELVDGRKQAKLQWLQDPSEANEDKQSNVMREASRHFRNKKRVYSKDKIKELESKSKNKNISDFYRGINEYEICYQRRINLVKDERDDLLADCHKIFNKFYYFCQLLNVNGAGGVRQTEMHTAEPFVPEHSVLESEAFIGKLKRYKSLGAD
jgi:hypothetical protein